MCPAWPAIAISIISMARWFSPMAESRYPRVLARAAIAGDAYDHSTGDDFSHFEQDLSLRYALIQNQERELYLSLDTHIVDLDKTAVFDESLAAVPEGLYDVGVGAVPSSGYFSMLPRVKSPWSFMCQSWSIASISQSSMV